jgi:thiol-disulfide isomerase/thioredoxin
MADLEKARKDFQASGANDVLDQPEKRKAVAEQALRPIKACVALLDELEKAGPAGKVSATQRRPEVFYLLALFGDDKIHQELQEWAKEDSPRGRAAQAGELMARWEDAHNKPDEQNKILDDVTAASKEKLKGTELLALLTFIDDESAESAEVKTRAEDLFLANATGKLRDSLQQEIGDRRKLRDLEGKPLTIKGSTVDDKTLSTDDWKGKVILVDFWATWCGPCKAELPRVKEMYEKYHDKGLEVLGVSCDTEKEALQSFIKDDPKMPWPQLFDAKNPEREWHPLADQYGIHTIPRMFLIDKKGVLRTVKARDNFEEMIPKLLAE